MADQKLVTNEMIQIQKKIREVRDEFAQSAVTEEFPDAQQMMENNVEIMDIVIDGLTEDKEITLARIDAIATAIGETSKDIDYTLDQAIIDINEIRKVLWDKMKVIFTELQVQSETIMQFVDIYNPIVDQFTYSFSDAYIKSYNQNLREAETEFLLLSAPVVPITEGVAIIPFVGSIDERRAELFMQKALDAATQHELNDVFIDLSAVTVIDTNVAYHIFQIVKALEVVGVNVFLIGIRPETSQTMVTLGIDFNEVKTYHSLQQALERQEIFK